MHFCLLTTGLLLAASGFTQNLTGIWRGTFYNPTELAMGGARYRYEVQINNNGREAKGVTYSYQTTRFYGKASLVGMWSPATKNFTLKEDRMLDLKIQGGGDGCLMTCYLTYRKEGDKEYLEGTYTSTNMNDKNAACGGGKVFLEKVEETDFELEDFLVKKPATQGKGVKPGQEDFVVKKPTNPTPTKPATTTPKPKAPTTGSSTTTAKKPPVTTPKPQTKPTTPAPKPDVVVTAPATQDPEKPNPTPPPVVVKKPEPEKVPVPAPLRNRQNELFKTIVTSEKTIEISFYDNGEIDGDTISVYNNNKLIASHQGLGTRPITLKLTLDDDNALQDIVMVAENLGRIPPNTALMIVNAGSQRYTLNLSSTEEKNAVVRFKYQAKAP